MKNKSIKNILIVSISLIGLMLVSTTIVVSFNSYMGFSKDVSNADVATSISALAFAIAVLWKYLYNLTNPE